jgi:hypothetical protein
MMGMNNGAQSLQRQNRGYMEDGGWINLRTGGNTRQNNLYPQDQFAMGGDLQVVKGQAEPISYNPYLPEGGETVMFRGPSHADGGMPVAYGKNPVEVEGGEPAVKLADGGGNSDLVVFGNLPIHNSYLSLLGDKDAKGKKFKNYVADLSKKEDSQNKTIESSTEKLNDLDVNNSFDQLQFASHKANLMGANMKLKDIAQKKQNASFLQQAINDTADEKGIVADELAKGNIKQAKKGTKLSKADDGIPLRNAAPYNAYNPYYGIPNINNITTTENTTVPISVSKKTASGKKNTSIGKSNEDVQKALADYFQNRDVNLSAPPDEQLNRNDLMGRMRSIPQDQTEQHRNPYIDIANAVLPYYRPTNAQPLDANQLLPEMYAMSTNQQEPVRAQTYQPRLENAPYNISMQDQLNEVTAQTRAAQKMAGTNSSAQAAIAAQAYGTKSNILANQFRTNQEQRANVYNRNITTENDAQLKNLGIYDTQYQREEAAKANTKATTLEALKSVADKYQRNKLENKTLQTYENLYNYRYDDRGRAINMNGIADFNMSGNSGMGYGGQGYSPAVGKGQMMTDSMGRPVIPTYDEHDNINGYKLYKPDNSTKIKKNGGKIELKNGSIVRSVKNL